MDDSRTVPRWVLPASFLIVIIVAASLRLSHLPTRPLGLHYDEAANGILAGEISRGLKRPIFIASYTGKEVLFFYWAALWMRIVGIGPLALRFSAASVGLMTVAAAAWAAYELLPNHRGAPWIALTSSAFLAVSFWHVLLSRYGFRAITQPLLQSLTVAALWHALRLPPPRKILSVPTAWLLFAGALCGLTAYTYLASRAFPAPLGLALAALLISDRERRRERVAEIAVFIALAALVLAPLARYWLTHPGSFTTRASQVAAETWVEAWAGIVACLRMFFLEGDPYIRFNLPGRPLLSPFVAGLFLVGLATALWRLVYLIRQPSDDSEAPAKAGLVFLLLSLPVMILPSALATNEITPSNLRAVGLLPFIYVFPALGLWTLLTAVGQLARRDGRLRSLLVPVASLLVLGILGARVAHTYAAWASSAALYYAADGDMEAVAEYLNQADLSSSTPYVASQHYRHPTVAYLAEDYDTVKWLTDGETLVFPAEGEALALYPRSAADGLPWIEALLPNGALTAAPAGPDGEPAFRAYRVTPGDAPTPEHRRAVNLGNMAHFLGYTLTNQARAGERLDVLVWWRVTGHPDRPDYRVVARLVDRWDALWGETQPLHYLSEQWAPGELIVDHLSIPIAPGAPPGQYTLRLGLYSASGDVRAPVLDQSGAYAGYRVELPVHVDRGPLPASAHDLGLDAQPQGRIDGVALLGGHVDTTTVRPGEQLRATLYWQATETAPAARELSLELGQITLFQGAPIHDTYPFSEWERGEIVADRYDPRLPLDAPPGIFRLRLEVDNAASFDLGPIVVQAQDRTFEVPSLRHRVGAVLGNQVELVGYDLSSDEVAAGDTLTVTLTWRALAEMTRDYTVFTHLVAPDGSMAGQKDRQPVGGTYPTTLWARGEVVTDVYAIPVSTRTPPGDHRLEVGMYLPETGTRLAIDGDVDNALILQTVAVKE